MAEDVKTIEKIAQLLTLVDPYLARLAGAFADRAYFDLDRLRFAEEEDLRKVKDIQEADITQIRRWQEQYRKCVVTLVCSSSGQSGQKAKQQEQEFDFPAPPSYQVLISKVELAFEKRFADEAYVLKQGKLVVDEESWRGMDKTKPVTILIVSIRKAFSKFTAAQGLAVLDISSITISSSLFTAMTLDLTAPLPAGIATVTGWRTVEDVIAHASNDLAVRAFASDPMSNSKEAKCREIISPLLFAAAILAEVQLHAEFDIFGRQAHGCVDWGMIYGDLAVVVVEARRDVKWLDKEGQLMAEIAGSREEFRRTQLTGMPEKEAADAMAAVPSWGILTNSDDYKFYKYSIDDGCPCLVTSGRVAVRLRKGDTNSHARDRAIPIVAFLKSILEEQRAAVNAITHMKSKRQRLMQQTTA